MHSLGYLTLDLRPAMYVLGATVLCAVVLQVFIAYAERRSRERTRRAIDSAGATRDS